jgi:hypothetical protein
MLRRQVCCITIAVHASSRNRTRCMKGKKLLRQWIESPTWDTEELERRHVSMSLHSSPRPGVACLVRAVLSCVVASCWELNARDFRFLHTNDCLRMTLQSRNVFTWCRQNAIETFINDMESRDGLRKVLSQVRSSLSCSSQTARCRYPRDKQLQGVCYHVSRSSHRL